MLDIIAVNDENYDIDEKEFNVLVNKIQDNIIETLDILAPLKIREQAFYKVPKETNLDYDIEEHKRLRNQLVSTIRHKKKTFYENTIDKNKLDQKKLWHELKKLVDIPANDILESFGVMFFEFCQESGYDKILEVLGATPRDFLQNLDALHDHLGTLYPGMRAPSFRCTERPEDGALVLHYYSDRPGLEYIVIGIVKLQRLHGTDVDVQILKTKEECDHVQFLITDTSAPGVATNPMIADLETLSIEPNKKKFLLKFGVRPHLELTFENIVVSHQHCLCVENQKGVMQVEASEEFSNLRLKGQMLYIPESDLVIFLCYPSVMNLDDLTR
ncbi:hypothetical protein KQX54_008547 [Cotesia glomerata]|uniref:guanylate cyclase n=1 Tax=Cotesia glomerata TaxID=32391 RepID=A0AAV7IC81_COTGL|nr:hypothetical protein KQX54_008547 [Cotesia glomerata]